MELHAETIRIPADQVHNRFYQILLSHHFPERKAKLCADTFMNNSLEGVYTHGINRFSKFISYVRKNLIDPHADPVRVSSVGFLEQWDGQAGIGITNAFQCMDRAIEMADSGGISCVALANTNHWMRAGTYARYAASKGMAAICWSNTIRNTAAWGAVDPRLGNNPITIGIPYQHEHVVLDMAMSQFSYGALEQYQMNGATLPVPGGFDQDGHLTTNPDHILKSRRTLPIGYWKGTGLSLLLDLLATILSGGLSVSEISKQREETRLSQVFIALSLGGLKHNDKIPQLISRILDDFHQSIPEKDSTNVRYPGEKVAIIKKDNLEKGIPVLKSIWNEISSL